MSKSPTQRSLEFFRELGYVCQVVEYWNQHARQRVDLFGVIDIVAITEGKLVGIQATSRSNHNARLNKIAKNEIVPLWLATGSRLVVQSWEWNREKKQLRRRTTKIEQTVSGKLHFVEIFR